MRSLFAAAISLAVEYSPRTGRKLSDAYINIYQGGWVVNRDEIPAFDIISTVKLCFRTISRGECPNRLKCDLLSVIE